MSIAEVAKAAGVSTATVSRVLNDFPGVRSETVQQVRAAVAALRYTPLRNRKTSRPSQSNGGIKYAQKTGNIAVITMGHSRDWLQLPVMASVVRGIQRAAGELGQRLILDELRDPTKISSIGKGQAIDGAVVFVASESPFSTFEPVLSALKRKIPVVWAMGTETVGMDLDHVTANNLAIGQLAFRSLQNRGCERVAYLTVHPDWAFMRLRAQAFLTAALDAGQPGTAFILSEDEILAETYGRRVVMESRTEDLVAAFAAMPERPDGLFVSNDATTARIYPLLAKYGLKPGENIEIISCDNEDVRLSSLHPRPLSIDIGAEEIGFRAGMRLRGRLQYPDHPAILVQISPKLVAEGRSNLALDDM